MNASTKTLLAAGGVLILTVIHHVYGAVIYATPWRYHVVFIAVPVLIVLVQTYGIQRMRPGTALGTASNWLFMILVLVVPVAVIGYYEGGYNHALKNALYFGGASPAMLGQLFPPPRYELPNDVWFEVTGVLQFVLGVAATGYLVRTWRDMRVDGRARATESTVSDPGSGFRSS